MRKINLSKDAQKFLTRIHTKHARQLALKIQSLAINPLQQDTKTLKEYGFLRVDSGEYRIIYEVKGDHVAVLLIGKRNDDEVYRKLKRKSH